ncbi:MAG: cytochrome c biogenesis protein CcsA [Pseudomonadota bacterium]
MDYPLFADFLNALTHPFVAQGLFTLFVLFEGLLCIRKTNTGNAIRYTNGALLCVLFIWALSVHIVVDTRYLFVLQNNHPAQAIHYRIASLWSHHETSLFIWLVILNSTTYILRLPPDSERFRRRILGLLNGMIGFYLLMEANPFWSTPTAQLFETGQGLNPLLYDMNMVWHPPLLYLGVTWLFTPYVLSLWLYRTDDATLIPWIQQQTKIAFGVLTLAIALGSFWAFTQLGWGGFWFWDPVETASLLPWLSALIVFHTAPSELKRNPWISGVPFVCVMISLWAVRSGILVSVHSFANDVLAFWVLGAMAFFASMPILLLSRATQMRMNPEQAPAQRASPQQLAPQQLPPHELAAQWQWNSAMLNAIPFLKVGIYLLCFTLFLLVLGLFVPVLFDFALDASFFNTLLLPIWVLIAILMMLAPHKGIHVGAPLTMALLGVILYVTMYAHLAFPCFLLGASGALCVGAMLPLCRVKPSVSFAHMGVGLCLIGLASYSDGPPETTLTLVRGVPFSHMSYNMTYEGMSEVAEPFKANQSMRIFIKRGDKAGGNSLILTPARQFFHSSQLQRVKADFGLLGQHVLMITNIERLSNSSIAITFHEKSGLLWLVLGCGLIVMSVLIISMRSVRLFREKDRK